MASKTADPTLTHPAAGSPAAMSRACRRTAVAFWAVAGLLVSLVTAIVVFAVINRPKIRSGAYSMTVSGADGAAGTPTAVVVRGLRNGDSPAKPPASLPAGWRFTGAVTILNTMAERWLAAAPAGSATPTTVYLYRDASAPSGVYYAWMNSAGWLGVAGKTTPRPDVAAAVQLTPS